MAAALTMKASACEEPPNIWARSLLRLLINVNGGKGGRNIGANLLLASSC